MAAVGRSVEAEFEQSQVEIAQARARTTQTMWAIIAGSRWSAPAPCRSGSASAFPAR